MGPPMLPPRRAQPIGKTPNATMGQGFISPPLPWPSRDKSSAHSNQLAWPLHNAKIRSHNHILCESSALRPQLSKAPGMKVVDFGYE
ncbi:hypothetical protein RRG08_039586 [Elysia crispata]|uniref:Uncharacterized protein n=1 Tax=Elysia crispata TaxID=231223 RepID=A0AAE1AJU5_9GAST|nr:hypothetical protein RRG08_039586 [Elysia crispata]